MNIGAKIKEVRTHFGLTQKKLAEKSGLAEITIRQYESGKREPKLEALIKIANALDVAVVVFIDDEHLGDDEINDIMSKQRANILGPTKELASSLSNIEIDILHLFKRLDDTGKQAAEDILFTLSYLNALGQEKAINYIDDLSKISEYKK